MVSEPRLTTIQCLFGPLSIDQSVLLCPNVHAMSGNLLKWALLVMIWAEFSVIWHKMVQFWLFWTDFSCFWRVFALKWRVLSQYLTRFDIFVRWIDIFVRWNLVILHFCEVKFASNLEGSALSIWPNNVWQLLKLFKFLIFVRCDYHSKRSYSTYWLYFGWSLGSSKCC